MPTALQTDLSIGTPLPAAVQTLDLKQLVPSVARTADWERMTPGFRQRAFFSAAVESARMLEEMKRRLLIRLRQERAALANGRDRVMSRELFIQQMQDLAEELGLRPDPKEGGRGSLQDIGSERRLRLIWDVQVGLAEGEARWRTDMDPDVLAAVPAQELVRKSARMIPRDWPQRWDDAGGIFYGGGGRMIALKTDPIWYEISRFGVPWPPFDFESGMGLRNIRRKEAEALGLIGPEWEPPSNVVAEHDAYMERSLMLPLRASAVPPEGPPNPERPSQQPDAPKIDAAPEFTPEQRARHEYNRRTRENKKARERRARRPDPVIRASSKPFSAETIERLEQTYGDLIEHDPEAGHLVWRGDLIQGLIDNALARLQGGDPAPLPLIQLGQAGDAMAARIKPNIPAITGQFPLQIHDSDIFKIWRDHGPGAKRRRGEPAITPEDIWRVIFAWRSATVNLTPIAKRPLPFSAELRFRNERGELMAVVWRVAPDAQSLRLGNIYYVDPSHEITAINQSLSEGLGCLMRRLLGRRPLASTSETIPALLQAA